MANGVTKPSVGIFNLSFVGLAKRFLLEIAFNGRGPLMRLVNAMQFESSLIITHHLGAPLPTDFVPARPTIFFSITTPGNPGRS